MNKLHRMFGRNGISLLEVLISIFVLTIGLLGIVSLIPLGTLEVVRTAKADRSAACGRACLNELEVRGFLDPTIWRNADATATVVVQTDPSTPSTGFGVLSNAESYAIDPLFWAKNYASAGTTNINRFPYLLASPYAPYYPGQTMRRVTVNCIAQTGLSSTQITGLFEKIFGWRDDLAFNIPDTTTARPSIMYTLVNGTFSHDPSSSNGALRAEAEGNYTWLATVTPDPAPRELAVGSTPPFASYFFVKNKRRWIVSIVVFHKRNLTLPASGELPSERAVKAIIQGNGLSGGDLRLFVDSGTPNLSHYLTPEPTEWMLLCGQRKIVHSVGPPEDAEYVNVFQWYRIVATEDPDPANPQQRYITVAGPDWNMNWCLNTSTYEVQAVLFDGISGVYTETVELD